VGQTYNRRLLITHLVALTCWTKPRATTGHRIGR